MESSLFRLIKPAPLTEPVSSRIGCIYMYRAMWLMGWLPPKDGLIRYLYNCWTFVTFGFGTVYLSAGFAMSYVLEFNNFTPDEFLTSLQVALNVFGTAVKATILYRNLWRLTKTEDIMDGLDKRARSDSDRHKMHIIVARSNLVFLIFTIVYCVYVGSTFLSYVFSGRPPWSVYNPFLDWHKSTRNLWIQAIFEYIIMSFAVMTDQLADTYLLVFLIIIRGHFDVLKDHVRNLRMDPDMSEQDNYEEIVNCIKDHKKIKECCNMLRPVISGTIFVQFGLIGSVLGLTLINVFFFSNLWRGLASFMFVVAVLMETFPFCYTCNWLLDDCDDLSNALFQSKWIDAELRYKSTLTHFMHQAQQPILFMAGGIIPITMNSNISVAKFAFSIITIVREMNLAEQFK
ncbi:uncharacterized protein Dvir_GJ10682 [Drosophila virilis]|uniref:Odorant receptor n=2 Tax=Drosophila virilis TaxID=7244 RepID=B4M615_DROVI|nr:uncharacterized protein Dvir_GJ10682 [Drosophila virilis]